MPYIILNLRAILEAYRRQNYKNKLNMKMGYCYFIIIVTIYDNLYKM